MLYGNQASLYLRLRSQVCFPAMYSNSPATLSALRTFTCIFLVERAVILDTPTSPTLLNDASSPS